ncbi:hypothetical protein [Brevundimonas sp. PAMC22021]|uniref:hypothetical protein n=1 Tax=Brevundimonas sp. PAMC22021 TaxID=2861285 RepID=UPI001C625506|nr:hypothetical protein [Brevundimonas sp. PAMC22021]QYF87373.1 hypothetical protein KY493_02385 [Brevundimonas sp. PAMC22021]
MGQFTLQPLLIRSKLLEIVVQDLSSEGTRLQAVLLADGLDLLVDRRQPVLGKCPALVGRVGGGTRARECPGFR